MSVQCLPDIYINMATLQPICQRCASYLEEADHLRRRVSSLQTQIEKLSEIIKVHENTLHQVSKLFNVNYQQPLLAETIHCSALEITSLQQTPLNPSLSTAYEKDVIPNIAMFTQQLQSDFQNAFVKIFLAHRDDLKRLDLSSDSKQDRKRAEDSQPCKNDTSILAGLSNRNNIYQIPKQAILIKEEQDLNDPVNLKDSTHHMSAVPVEMGSTYEVPEGLNHFYQLSIELNQTCDTPLEINGIHQIHVEGESSQEGTVNQVIEMNDIVNTKGELDHPLPNQSQVEIQKKNTSEESAEIDVNKGKQLKIDDSQQMQMLHERIQKLLEENRVLKEKNENMKESGRSSLSEQRPGTPQQEQNQESQEKDETEQLIQPATNKQISIQNNIFTSTSLGSDFENSPCFRKTHEGPIPSISQKFVNANIQGLSCKVLQTECNNYDFDLTIEIFYDTVEAQCQTEFPYILPDIKSTDSKKDSPQFEQQTEPIKLQAKRKMLIHKTSQHNIHLGTVHEKLILRNKQPQHVQKKDSPVEVVEKIVLEYVYVPIIRQVPIQTFISKPVEKIVQKIVYLPMFCEIPVVVIQQVPTAIIQQKIVEVKVPVQEIVENIVETRIEVPIIREVPVEIYVDRVSKEIEIREVEVINERIVEVEKIVYVPQIRESIIEVQVIKQIQVPVEVPVYIERVVQKIVQVVKVEVKEVPTEVGVEKIAQQKKQMEVENKMDDVMKIQRQISSDRSLGELLESEVPSKAKSSSNRQSQQSIQIKSQRTSRSLLHNVTQQSCDANMTMRNENGCIVIQIDGQNLLGYDENVQEIVLDIPMDRLSYYMIEIKEKYEAEINQLRLNLKDLQLCLNASNQEKEKLKSSCQEEMKLQQISNKESIILRNQQEITALKEQLSRLEAELVSAKKKSAQIFQLPIELSVVPEIFQVPVEKDCKQAIIQTEDIDLFENIELIEVPIELNLAQPINFFDFLEQVPLTDAEIQTAETQTMNTVLLFQIPLQFELEQQYQQNDTQTFTKQFEIPIDLVVVKQLQDSETQTYTNISTNISQNSELNQREKTMFSFSEKQEAEEEKNQLISREGKKEAERQHHSLLFKKNKHCFKPQSQVYQIEVRQLPIVNQPIQLPFQTKAQTEANSEVEYNPQPPAVQRHNIIRSIPQKQSIMTFPTELITSNFKIVPAFDPFTYISQALNQHIIYENNINHNLDQIDFIEKVANPSNNSDSEEEKNNFSSQLENTHDVVDKLREDIKLKESQIIKLKKESDVETHKYEEYIRDKDQNIRKLEKGIRDMQNTIEEYKTKLDYSLEDKQKVKKEMEKMIDSWEKIKEESDKTELQHKQLIEKLQLTIRQKTTEFNQNEYCNKHNKQLYEAQLVQLKDIIHQNNQKIDLLKEELQKKQDKIDELNDRIDEIMRENAEIIDEQIADIYKKEFEEVKAKFEDEKQKQAIQIDELYCKIDQLENKNLEEIQRAKEAEKNMEELEEKVVIAREKQQQIQRLKNNLEEIYYENIKQLKEMRDLVREKDVLIHNHNIKLEAALSDKKDECPAFDLPSSKIRIQYLSKQVSRQTDNNNNINHLQEHCRKLQNLLLAYEKMMVQNQHKIEQLQGKVYEYLRDACEKEKQSESLYLRLVDYENTINNILVEKVTLEAENKRLKRTIDSSEKKIRVLADRLVEVARKRANYEQDDDNYYYK